MLSGLFSQLINVVLPVVLAAAIGYLWVRRKMPFDNATTGAVVMHVATPCLVLTSLLGLDVRPETLLEIGAGVVAAQLLAALLSTILLGLFGMSLRDYLPLVMFPNIGNTGLPVLIFAFGMEAVALGMPFFILNLVTVLAIGIPIAAGKFRMHDVIASPTNWSIVIALILMVIQAETMAPGEKILPLPLERTMALFAAMSFPLMLMTLGASLATLRTRNLGRGIGLGAARLLIGCAAGLGGAWLVGLEGTARAVVVVQSSMPAAVITYLIALRYGGKAEDAAAIVMASTLMMIPLLPILLVFIVPASG